MQRNIRWVWLCVAMVAAGCFAGIARAAEPQSGKFIGMYIHQHWPYNHPYAARTWTLDDWHGYLDGLHRLGFNAIMVWPVLETMPQPLTASDRENLEKISRVIDLAHSEFGMKVWIALCPNVVADSAAAGQAVFTQRHFFHCDLRVNPADREAVGQMIRWREQIMRPLAKADAVSIIDSDPGGYPGSTNAEFVNLLVEHRKMFDRLRPGIELVYWMHAGWPGYCRLYETAKYQRSTFAELEQALALLKQANPEPWGVANGLEQAEKLGIASRVISFRYGAIEAEPSFPMTNFGGDAACQAGGRGGPRGVMGNAQTHCVQLPNTFAFVRGALGKPVAEADYLAFAEQLIPGQGATILAGWKALGVPDATAMRSVAERLQGLGEKQLAAGPLRGLLFGDPQRFVLDLVFQLRLKAALAELRVAAEKKQDLCTPLAGFIAAAEAWQQRHGYQCQWHMPQLVPVLLKLRSPEIQAVLTPTFRAQTPFGRVKEQLYFIETHTTRLLAAMKLTLSRMQASSQSR